MNNLLYSCFLQRISEFPFLYCIFVLACCSFCSFAVPKRLGNSHPILYLKDLQSTPTCRSPLLLKINKSVKWAKLRNYENNCKT